MASLRDIKKRIQSVKSTQKITRAMKMVSAARLKRAQDAILMARAYAHRLNDVISSLASRTDTGIHPLLQAREEKKKLVVVVFTSDRGLCGAFNSGLLKNLEQYIRDESPKFSEGVDLYVIGKKGYEYLKRRNYNIVEYWTNIYKREQFEAAREIGEKLIQRFLDGECDEVVLLNNHFRSAISQVPYYSTVLPVKPIEPAASTPADAAGPSTDYIYEPDRVSLINELLPRNIFVQAHRAILESIASELGARMTAMDNATTNAGDMILRLSTIYNKTRQASITKELMEIISGAESIKK